MRLQFANDATYEKALGCLDAERSDARLRTIEVATDGSADAVHDLLARLSKAGTLTAKVSTHQPSLDDVFLSLTGSRTRNGASPMTVPYPLIDSRVMVKRCVRRSLRNPEAFFTALMLPVVLMLLFVYVFGGALKTGGAYVDYVVPGLIVLCAGFGAGTTAVAVATDMTNGIVDRFRSMPISGSTILLGQIVASLARNLIATALVIFVGLGVGWRPSGSFLDWVAAAGMIVLFVLALSWLAAAVGLLAGSPEAATSFSMVLMFVPYVSTAFVPAHTMPWVLRGFANNQPFTPIIETMRGLWMGHTSMGASVGHEAVIAVLYCVGILVVSVGAASWLFRHRTSA